jgi:hypothetical protein
MADFRRFCRFCHVWRRGPHTRRLGLAWHYTTGKPRKRGEIGPLSKG